MTSLCTLILFFHLVRNLSPVYYLLVVCSYLVLFAKVIKCVKPSSFLVLSIVVVSALYVSIISYTSRTPETPLIGLGRLFFIAPFLIYLFSTRLSNKEVHSFWMIVIAFACLSSLSLVLQTFIGPIPWFAESSFGRAGVDRFASLAGSLTAYGSLLPAPILAASLLIRKQNLKLIVLVILLIGGVLSLQKMALGTSILAFILLGVRTLRSARLHKIKPSYFTKTTLVVFMIAGLLILFKDQPYVLYFFSIFNPSQQAMGDVSLIESLSSRVDSLPSDALLFWGGIQNAWPGVGVMGASGGLGYPDYPSPHNLIYEVLLVFGLPISIFIFSFLSYGFCLAVKNIISDSGDYLFAASACFVLMLLPSIFSGGLFYHPVSGTIFWFSCSRLIQSRKMATC